MSNKLINEIKKIIDINKNNNPDISIETTCKTFSISIINEEKEEIETIYEIDLKTFLNSILDNNLELEWF